MRPRSFPRLPVLILAVSLCSLKASAQENMELGRMWTFENPPLAYLEKEYGFKPDQAWLNNLRPGDPVYVSTFGKSGTVVRMQLHKQTALVSIGAVHHEVQLRVLARPSD